MTIMNTIICWIIRFLILCCVFVLLGVCVYTLLDSSLPTPPAEPLYVLSDKFTRFEFYDIPDASGVVGGEWLHNRCISVLYRRARF